MSTTYLHFDAEGRFVAKTAQPGDGFFSFPCPVYTEIGERFQVVNGQLVDNNPNISDEQFMVAVVEAQRLAAEVVPPAQPQTSAQLTRLAFMNRFTVTELAAIYTAAKTEVLLEVFLDKLRLAEFVDTSDSNTVAGVNALAAAGLLASDRVSEILA
jgi:hypothetical protein